MPATATVRGGDALVRRLLAMPPEVREEVRIVMGQQADEIVEMMQSLAPIDEGELRASIKWHWGRPHKARVGRNEDLALTIAATDYKAGWHEFGTVKMPAHPFFFVSWRANRQAAKRAINRAARKAIKRVIASGA